MSRKYIQNNRFITGVRFAAEYVAFRFIAAVLTLLGPDKASEISGRLWTFFAPLSRRHDAALRHIEVALPKAGGRKRRNIVNQAWDNLGRTAAETMLMSRMSAETSRIKLRSPEIMEIIAKANGRAVIATLHMGNWELFAPYFKAAGFPMALIYKRVKNPFAERYLRYLRAQVYPGGLHMKGEKAPLRLMAWVKSNHPVLILADQRSGKIKTSFFGYPARSTPLPAFIARRLDAPLIAGRIIRTSGVNFELELADIPVPKTGDRDQDIEKATQVLQQKLESWIRETPEQWMWSHRRWTSAGPPEGWKNKGRKRKGNVWRKSPFVRSIRYAVEYAFLRLVVMALRTINVDRASAMNGKLWALIAPHTSRHKAALRHLELAFPEKTPEERQVIAHKIWNNLGRTTAEAFSIDTFADEPSRVRFISPEILKRILEHAGGRAVIAPMHSGNWEVLAPAFTELGLSGALIYQRVKNPHSDRFLRETRMKYCPGGMFSKDSNPVRRLVSWLSGGNVVVILADQRIDDGIETKFFGHAAPSTPLPAYLARSFDAPLIACRVVRREGAHFDLEFREIPVPHSADRQVDIAKATQSLQSAFEDWIREYPDQWMWAHRRWSYDGPPENWKTQT